MSSPGIPQGNRWFLCLLLGVAAITTSASGQTISLAPATLAFGNQVVATTSGVKRITLTNTGTAGLTISSIAVSVPFGQTNTCGSGLGAGTKCTISITFTPSTTGGTTGTLTVSGNAGNSPQAATLTGTGVLPVTLSPTVRGFGSVTLGTTSTPVIFTLTNNLSTAVTISSIATTGNFAQTNTCSATLAAKGKCTISTTLTPTVTGTQTGTLAISDTASNSPQTASLSGSGNTNGLVSVKVTPSVPSVSVGGSLQFDAVGTFNTGRSYDVTQSAAWTTSKSSVAAMTSGGSKGNFTGVGVGTTTIKAALSGINGSTTLTVVKPQPVLISIAVTPQNPAIALGSIQQFVATGTYSDGSTQNLTGITQWTSGTAAIAGVSGSGLATTLTSGSTTIAASLGSISGSTTLTVNPAALVSIAVTPANGSIALGTMEQCKATGTYTDGSTLDLTTLVNWKSSATAVATVSNTPGTQGLANSLAVGSSSLSASLGTITGSTNLAVTPAALVSIVVTPAIPTISLGISQQFTATGNYTDGSTQNIGNAVQWSSDTADVATISNASGRQGLASSVGAGTTTISASSGTILGSTILTVSPAVLVSIVLSPANPSLSLDSTEQFTAAGTFTDGSTQNVTSAVTWSSDTPTVATVNAGGLVIPLADGTTDITATSGTVSASTALIVTEVPLVSINVNPAVANVAMGTTQQFTATGTYSDSSVQDITATVHWSSSDGTLATVSNDTGTAGLASTLGSGAVTILASSGTISGFANLTVTPAALMSIAVSPQNPSIALGASQHFTAIGTFSDGSTQDLTSTATWDSSTAAAAVISNSPGTQGLATSAGVGLTTITATLGSITGSANLAVNTATVVSIAVSPSSGTVPLGAIEQFTALGTYSDGTTQDLTGIVNWGSSNIAIAVVSNAGGRIGLASTLAAGSVTIQASLGTIIASATLTVLPPALASIAIAPLSATISAGTSQQFTATGIYADGSTQDVTSSVFWLCPNSSVATISNLSGARGLAKGIAVGACTITATLGSQTTSANLLVTGALQSIVVTPTAPILPAGTSSPMNAIALYADGGSQDVTAQTVWQSTAPAIATVASNGAVNAVSMGTVRIYAVYRSHWEVIPIVVGPRNGASLSSLNITGAATLTPSSTSQLTATGVFSDGTSLNLISVLTWDTSDPTAVVVYGAMDDMAFAGQIVGISAGTATISASYGQVTSSFSATVTGTTPLVTGLYTSPLNPTLAPGASQELRGELRFGNGTVSEVAEPIRWTSSDPTVVAVEPNGMADAVSNGSATVTATLGSWTSTILVTVESGGGRIPLDQMGPADSYLGFSGGLYGFNSNTMPPTHNLDGLVTAAAVVPLNSAGQPDPVNGKIIMLGLGMSNALIEFSSFVPQAQTYPAINPNLSIVNGTKGSEVMCEWTVWQPGKAVTTSDCTSALDPQNQYDRVQSQLLCGTNCNNSYESQVEVVWFKNADSRPALQSMRTLCDPAQAGCVNDNNTDAIWFEVEWGRVMRALRARYPNLKQVFVESRIYAGYALGGLNPEPYAYEYGFSTQWLIQAQINQMDCLNSGRTNCVDPIAGDLNYANGTAAWIAWGPYLWAPGDVANGNGVVWLPNDLASDGTHPQQPKLCGPGPCGAQKV
ncbi:MAG: trimeric autotransporter adhesin, partial [Acidobacteriaceae bacterium]|nr:trimeric autotransporter adhesin [Acidobacteriaceae bacterium]